MNKAYKVVFNKLRGTMMVVNEATSSIQKKGAKTVIAASVAAILTSISGAAMADDPMIAIDGAVYSEDSVTKDGLEVTHSSSIGHRNAGIFASGSSKSLIFTGDKTSVILDDNSTTSEIAGVQINQGASATFSAQETVIDVKGLGASGLWGFGLLVNGSMNESVVFDGGDVSIKNYQENYTSQTLTAKDGGKIDFNNSGNVYIGSKSPKSVTGGDIWGNITFNNSGNVTFDSELTTNQTGAINGVGIQMGNAGNLKVTSRVNNFLINVVGQGVDNDGTSYSTGTVGLKVNSSLVDISSKTFSISMTAASSLEVLPPQNHSATKMYGIWIGAGQFTSSADTAVSISMDSGIIPGKVIGVLGGGRGQLNIGGDLSISVAGAQDAYGINISDGIDFKAQGNARISAIGTEKVYAVSVQDGAKATFSGNSVINASNGYALFATTSDPSAGSSITLSGAVNHINGRVYASGQRSQICLKGDTTITYNGEGAAVVVGEDATFEVSGNLTLGGYIDNAGTVTFADGSSLSLVLTNDMIKAGEHTVVDGGTLNWSNKATLIQNALYDIAWTDEQGTVSIKQKSAESLVESLPVTSQQAGTIAAILPTATAPATPELGQIANAIRSAASGEEIAQIAEDLAPSTAPVVSSVSQGVNNAIAGVANARMAANRAAGDVFTGGSAWAQMIYNSADQDATKKTAKLESDTYGITVGIDGKIGDNLTIGAGFGVTKTDAESGTRDIDVDSYALFGYTEYNADNGWFMNGMVNAIRGRYEENKTPAGIKLTAKYQTTVLGAGVATGYHFENGISPEVGLRYLRTHQGSYNDGAQKIHTDGTNLLTASIGAKYEKAFEQGDWVLKPSARVAATYDVVSDDTESAIRVIGGGQYHIISAHQKRAAYEAGLGLEASNGDWDFSVSYNGEFRSHFQSHTGMLKAKYNF